MAARNYELKKGVLLQALGHPSKTCTNDTLTDELAEWHLKNSPGTIVFFSRYPAKVRSIPPADIKIIKPEANAEPEAKIEESEKIEPEATDEPPADIAGEALASAMGEINEPNKTVKKPARKPASKAKT